MNIGSRKEVHKLIKTGNVTINGQKVKTPKEKVKENDPVEVNGQEIVYEQYHYFLLNKPKGVLSATEDLHQKTVIDLLKSKDRYKDLAPVGRLDKDTTGLLLITNDGQLNHELLAPTKHVDKVYEALIAGQASADTIATFASGMKLKDGTVLKPAKLEVLDVDEGKDQSKIRITIKEGKYHQIKRMFGAVGMKVLELDRLQMGDLSLDPNLKRGQYRELTSEELDNLKS